MHLVPKLAPKEQEELDIVTVIHTENHRTLIQMTNIGGMIITDQILERNILTELTPDQQVEVDQTVWKTSLPSELIIYGKMIKSVKIKQNRIG